MFRILITDRFDVDALAYLKGDRHLEVQTSLSAQPSPEELRDTEGLVIRSRTKITAQLLDQAPHLKVIVTATSGFDHIDLAETQKRKLIVMHTPEANAASAAELTWALVLACARRVRESHRAVKDGDWRREALIGRQLEGSTYGIVGLGRIGGRVARIARAFGMNVVAYDPYQDDLAFAQCSAQRVAFDELCKMADVMSFHVPATHETVSMLHEHNIEFLNRNMIVINTSRGNVLSEKALTLALENGWISAVGLDVFEKEPLPRNSALTKFSNVVLTPHLGATTGEAFARASFEAAQKIRAFALSPEGARTSSDRLPPETEWFLACNPAR